MCPVQDANGAEHGSGNGQVSQGIEPPVSLAEAIALLAQSIQEQNHYLAQIVDQNADLIATVVNEDDGDEYDLSGRPL